MVATLKDSSIPLTKGLDGRRFIDAQSWLVEQEDTEVGTYTMLAEKLNRKYGDHHDKITPLAVEIG